MRGQSTLVRGESVCGLRVSLCDGSLHNSDYVLGLRQLLLIEILPEELLWWVLSPLGNLVLKGN